MSTNTQEVVISEVDKATTSTNEQGPEGTTTTAIQFNQEEQQFHKHLTLGIEEKLREFSFHTHANHIIIIMIPLRIHEIYFYIAK